VRGIGKNQHDDAGSPIPLSLTHPPYQCLDVPDSGFGLDAHDAADDPEDNIPRPRIMKVRQGHLAVDAPSRRDVLQKASDEDLVALVPDRLARWVQTDR